MEQEVDIEPGDQSSETANKQQNKYSFFNWALFALPGVMLVYPFKWIFMLVFGVMETGNDDVRHARQKDAEHNRYASYANRRDSATSVGLINLLVVIALVGAIYVGVKLGIDATLYVFTIPGVIYVLPLYFMGLYATFKTSALNNAAIEHAQALKYVVWISIPLALMVAFYVWTQGAFKSGPAYLGFVFAPLFIFSLWIFPSVLAMFSLVLFFKVSAKTASLKTAVLVSAGFSLVLSLAIYGAVSSTSIGTEFAKMAAEKFPKRVEKGPSLQEVYMQEVENTRRLAREQAEADAESVGGYESYPRSMVKKISSIHHGQPEAMEANTTNKGKGVVDVYIQPLPFNNGDIKIAVEGIEEYEYGMQMTPGKRKVIIVQEGYKTVEFTANMVEGGFYEMISMMPLD